jgi:hypothetical protein
MALLGVTPGCTAAELKAAYRRLVLTWHPDRHHGDPAMHHAALERTKAINEAYAALSARGGEEGDRPSPGKGRSRRHAFPSDLVPERVLRSRTIVSAGYDDRQRLLYVKFRKGVVYAYHDVPRPVYEGLLAARSHEKYADEHVFGKFPFTRV